MTCACVPAAAAVSVVFAASASVVSVGGALRLANLDSIYCALAMMEISFLSELLKLSFV